MTFLSLFYRCVIGFLLLPWLAACSIDNYRPNLLLQGTQLAAQQSCVSNSDRIFWGKTAFIEYMQKTYKISDAPDKIMGQLNDLVCVQIQHQASQTGDSLVVLQMNQNEHLIQRFKDVFGESAGWVDLQHNLGSCQINQEQVKDVVKNFLEKNSSIEHLSHLCLGKKELYEGFNDDFLNTELPNYQNFFNSDSQHNTQNRAAAIVSLKTWLRAAVPTLPKTNANNFWNANVPSSCAPYNDPKDPTLPILTACDLARIWVLKENLRELFTERRPPKLSDGSWTILLYGYVTTKLCFVDFSTALMENERSLLFALYQCAKQETTEHQWKSVAFYARTSNIPKNDIDIFKKQTKKLEEAKRQ